MNEAASRLAGEAVARHSVHRIRAPVGAHIGEDLSRAREQVTEEHCQSVEAVVLRGHDVRLANSVPIKGGVEDGLEEVAIGEVIRPLALSLESRRDGIVTQGLLAVAEIRQARVADHQVASDESHLHDHLPVRVLLLAASLHLPGIVVLALAAVGLCPLRGAGQLLGVVDPLVHTTDELRHVDRFDAHPQILLKESMLDNGPGNSHGYAAQ